MGYQSFKELRVWQEAKGLAIEVYKTTNQGKFKIDYGLRDQIQKAAVSIASNIAEGYERNSDKEFIRFLYIAKGSLSELLTQSCTSGRAGGLRSVSRSKRPNIF